MSDQPNNRTTEVIYAPPLQTPPMMLTPEQRRWLYERQLENYNKIVADINAVEMHGDDVVFIFGKEKIPVPQFNFKAMKQCWDIMGIARISTDTVERVNATLNIVCTCLEVGKRPVQLEELEDKLSPKDFDKLTASYGRLLLESGLLDLETMKPVEPVDSVSGEGRGGGVAGSTPSSSGNGSQEPTKEGQSPETEPNSFLGGLKGPTSIQ